MADEKIVKVKINQLPHKVVKANDDDLTYIWDKDSQQLKFTEVKNIQLVGKDDVLLSGATPFKKRRGDTGVKVENGNTYITSFEIKNKKDLIVGSTQLNNVCFRDDDLIYPSNEANASEIEQTTLTIKNFELQVGEVIVIYTMPNAVSSSGIPASVQSIVDRLEVLELMTAPILKKGAMLMWYLDEPIPTGWEEVKEMRGRFPMGKTDYVSATGELAFTDRVGYWAGNSVIQLHEAHIPKHSHAIFSSTVRSDSGNNTDAKVGKTIGYARTNAGSLDYVLTNTNDDEATLGKTSDVGIGEYINILNPYRIVIFIRYIGK